jgi:predicted Zn-dependent protease
VKHFETGLKEGRYLNKEAHTYGYVRALMKKNQHDKARRILKDLLKQRPSQVEYILTDAEIAEQMGDKIHAQETLATANMLMPDNYPIAVAYIEQLLADGNAPQAKKVTGRMRQLRPTDARLFRLLGRAEQLMGNATESHRLLAEAHVAEGLYEAAVQQLNIAQQNDDKSDFFLTARIGSRLQELKAIVAQQRKDNQK